MAKSNIKPGAEASPSHITELTQKLPDDKKQIMYQELRASGSVDNPVKYTETHLKGGDAHEK